jgi:hypothetical protein
MPKEDFFFLLFICAYNVWVISPPKEDLYLDFYVFPSMCHLFFPI